MTERRRRKMEIFFAKKRGGGGPCPLRPGSENWYSIGAWNDHNRYKGLNVFLSTIS
jgi:hypothetical protein